MLSPPLTYNMDCLHVCLLLVGGAASSVPVISKSPSPRTGWRQEWDCETGRAGSSRAIYHFDKRETSKARAVAHLLNATMKGGALCAFSLDAHSGHATNAKWTHHRKYFLSKVSFKPCNNLEPQALLSLLKTKAAGWKDKQLLTQVGTGWTPEGLFASSARSLGWELLGSGDPLCRTRTEYPRISLALAHARCLRRMR